MSQNSKSGAYALLASIAIGALLAKAFWVYLEYKTLPKSGVEKEQKSAYKNLYYRYSLASKKDKPKIVNKPKKNIVKPKPKPKPQQIKNFVLKGIYIDNRQKFIVISYKNKTTFLNLGEELEGYKLTKILSKSAIFTRDNKDYELKLFKEKKDKNISGNKKVNTTTVKKTTAKKAVTKQDVVKEGDVTIISKSLFDKYRTNITALRKEINAVPVMEGKKLKGFRVSYIKKGSVFEKSGVKRGDIITAINGEEITDFSVPINFFNNLNSITSATLTIKRGNEIKELEYEVR